MTTRAPLGDDGRINPRRRFLTCSGAALVALAARGARAEAGAASSPQPPPALVAPRAHRHDATFFRAGVGYGIVRGSSTRDLDGAREASSRSDHGIVYDLALGGALADGWIVGGGLVTYGGGSSRHVYDPSLTIVGAMTEVYPDPAGGFHAGATIGVAWLGDPAKQLALLHPFEQDDSALASGFGLSLDAGYEVWLARTFNVGALLRLSWGPHLVLDETTVRYRPPDVTEYLPSATRSSVLAFGAVATAGFD